MNDRADRLIKALGDIGEDLIEKAAPVYPADSEAGESIRTAVPAVYEPEVKITRKDRVIYWVTHSLGVAAAAILIIGAAVLLVQNWDKIAVKEPDRPGTVTSAAEPMESNESIVTLPPPLDYDSMSKEEKFAAQLMNGLRWRMNSAEVQLAASEYWGRTEPSRIHREDSDVLLEYYNVISYDDVEFYGGKANIALVVFDNAGLKSIEYQVRYDVSDDGAKSADEMYERIRADFVNALGEPNYPDLNWWDFADSKLHFGVYKADNWIVEIKIDDTSDPYEEITDTSMPEPYDDDPVRHIDFAAQWVSSFYTFEPMIPQEKRDMYYEWVQNPFGYTPYTITDNCNIISSVRKLELDWNDTKEILISSQVLSDDDISVIDNALTNSDESAFKHLIEKFRSPYAVIGDFNGNGYNVFSPLWLYYHTIGDYKAMRVPAKAVEDIIPIYASNLGLRDEAWAAFREKLYKYISGEKDNTAVTTSAVTESNGTMAVAVTSATTTSNVIGGTTVISDTDSSADDRPTDDELKALVEQGTEACGLKITVSDLTKASLKLNYYCEGDNSKYLAFMWGGKYEIQILSGNEWMTYDPDNFRRWNDEQMWFDSSFSINEFPDHSDEHETILFYGDNMYESEIPKGNYRVLKQIAVYGNGKNLGQLTAYAEFTIDEHTPNVFGITMTAKNVSPESVTLAVQQSGASFHVKRNLGYKARFVLERKTGSGEWKKVDGNPVTWAPDIEPINENGITEIKEDFSDIYGSLPDGTYRISKLFVNYVGTGETKDDILNSSTYYSTEFTLQDNVWYVTEVNAFGVSVAVKDVTTEGLTLVTKHDGTTLKSDVLCDQSRYVERMNDSGEWEEYLTMYIDAEERKLDVGKTFEEHITLSYDDDDILRPGKYRIRRVFNSFDNEAVCYANFEITDKTPNDWGIWAETEEVTADSITLIIHRENVKGLTDDMFPAISYYIEKRSENMIPDDWEKLEFLPGKEPINKYSDLELKTGAKERMRFDWKGVFGTLSAGEYRLKLKYKCGEKTKDCCFIFIIN